MPSSWSAAFIHRIYHMLTFYFTMCHVDCLLSGEKKKPQWQCVSLERVLVQGSRVWFHTPSHAQDKQCTWHLPYSSNGNVDFQGSFTARRVNLWLASCWYGTFPNSLKNRWPAVKMEVVVQLTSWAGLSNKLSDLSGTVQWYRSKQLLGTISPSKCFPLVNINHLVSHFRLADSLVPCCFLLSLIMERPKV